MRLSKSAVLTGSLSRRRLLASALGAAAASCLPRALRASREAGDVRALSFHNTHTDERLEVPYRVNGRWNEEGLTSIDWILRDHRTGDDARIDPELLETLWLLKSEVVRPGTAARFEVISGYRSPQSNETLRKRSGSVARHSLHLKGMAVDVRLEGVSLGLLRDAALDLRKGGVGFYPADGFIHLDTGRVRRW